MLCKTLRNKIIKIALIATMAVSVTVAPIMHTYLTPTVSAASSLDELQEKQNEIEQQKEESRSAWYCLCGCLLLQAVLSVCSQAY